MVMNISGVSMLDPLAALATNLKTGQLSMQFSTAILKNQIDSQQQFGAELVQMMRATPSLEGTGRIIDVNA